MISLFFFFFNFHCIIIISSFNHTSWISPKPTISLQSIFFCGHPLFIQSFSYRLLTVLQWIYTLIYVCVTMFRAPQVVLMVENTPANAGDARDTGSIPGSGDPLKEGMVIHSSIHTWRISWTEEPGKLLSIGSQRIRYDWSDLAQHTTFNVE